MKGAMTLLIARWIPVEEQIPDYEQLVAYRFTFQGHPMVDARVVYIPDEFKPGNEDHISHWFPLPERE